MLRLKNLVRLLEQQPVDLKTFMSLMKQTGRPLQHLQTFLIRLDRLRKRNSQ